jgi:hypothetical protein
MKAGPKHRPAGISPKQKISLVVVRHLYMGRSQSQAFPGARICDIRYSSNCMNEDLGSQFLL